MTLLDVVPKTECDEHGVPLDWKRCRGCRGGMVIDTDRPGATSPRPCPRCEGCGSLEKAVLAELERLRGRRWSIFTEPLDKPFDPTVRCGGCAHPMSDGTWVPADHLDHEERRDRLRRASADFTVAERSGAVFYSPCDERCRHGGPGRHRWADEDYYTWQAVKNLPGPLENYEAEASWRHVTVRTMNGWPHDLREGNLGILCLRCWVAR